jgi:hypothetical protein
LFIRKQGSKWRAYLLDFEDTYRPSISLRKENSGIVVFQNHTRWGYFDESRGALRRDSTGSEVEGVLIDYDPPGDWWSRLSSIP